MSVLVDTNVLLRRIHPTSAHNAEWKRLVFKHSVQGAKAHDTRSVAAMNVHGVVRIVTFNGDDFRRFGTEILDPSVTAA